MHHLRTKKLCDAPLCGAVIFIFYNQNNLKIIKKAKSQLIIKKGHLEMPVNRRSRESGNSEKSSRWIPAYAKMTGFSRFQKVKSIYARAYAIQKNAAQLAGAPKCVHESCVERKLQRSTKIRFALKEEVRYSVKSAPEPGESG